VFDEIPAGSPQAATEPCRPLRWPRARVCPPGVARAKSTSTVRRRARAARRKERACQERTTPKRQGHLRAIVNQREDRTPNHDRSAGSQIKRAGIDTQRGAAMLGRKVSAIIDMQRGRAPPANCGPPIRMMKTARSSGRDRSMVAKNSKNRIPCGTRLRRLDPIDRRPSGSPTSEYRMANANPWRMAQFGIADSQIAGGTAARARPGSGGRRRRAPSHAARQPGTKRAPPMDYPQAAPSAVWFHFARQTRSLRSSGYLGDQCFPDGVGRVPLRRSTQSTVLVYVRETILSINNFHRKMTQL